jgi:hypothetical protein
MVNVTGVYLRIHLKRQKVTTNRLDAVVFTRDRIKKPENDDGRGVVPDRRRVVTGIRTYDAGLGFDIPDLRLSDDEHDGSRLNSLSNSSLAKA